MTQTLYIVDVFALRRYAGNPLAVVIGTEPLTDETMQQIAAETNYSETTFVTPHPNRHGGYAVRLFTPAREIDFAGHPILGTAWVIRRHLSLKHEGPLRLDLPVGPIAVHFETDAATGEEVLWFQAPPMTLGPACETAAMAHALGIAPEDIDAAAPIQQVSAGTAAMIVPLVSLDALHRSRLDLAAYAPLAERGFPPLVYLFCRETEDPENDLGARFFFEAHGVREDPATGNGAAFLGAWLLEHRMSGDADLSLRIEQGRSVNRPSLVMLRARRQDGAPDIRVGGRVIPVVKGELL
ncbi:MAG: PhzF family phenazine biosynthesis protein [Chromatiales bacterium]|nr:PhzF family phenazine biosynthesis protein [Chromatiales bacterium]